MKDFENDLIYYHNPDPIEEPRFILNSVEELEKSTKYSVICNGTGVSTEVSLNKSTASRQLFLRYEFLPRQAASSCVSACKSVFFVHASTMRSNCPDFLSKTEPPSSQSFA